MVKTFEAAFNIELNGGVAKHYHVKLYKKPFKDRAGQNNHSNHKRHDEPEQKHLASSPCQEPGCRKLTRDFKIWVVDIKDNQILKGRSRELGVCCRKLSKGHRWEQEAHNPILKKKTSLVRLAAALKRGVVDKAELKDQWGDHGRGGGGWNKLLWDRLELVPWGE
ncbi:unnamed protein product [Polarella glacialis]|uniref:Uncharacterized protein n=1 Tax=Polarella glacialis TaxID=89957 RepID=A0A813EZR0_POLGL|nr:unnamed protein product [Polarella glacialis]